MFSRRTKACEPTPLRPHWVCLKASTCDHHSASPRLIFCCSANYLRALGQAARNTIKIGSSIY
ncbi:hypothetical protein E2C01_073427 [Portunus trituberculatus]|uniref:Uncharacterized protein n=1 Tax=Portunus trituberculatus TaxID=210409 RepID=A0A5B7I2Y7_PORTR|nr:hypothetical protein [Portunus trituberculatus]